MGRSRGNSRDTFPLNDHISVGLVSPVKFQGQCGSCTAFASTAAIEICIKKASNEFIDISEQHLIDCARGHLGANGCSGTQIYAYLDWAEKENNVFSTNKEYPYKNLHDNRTYQCGVHHVIDSAAVVTAAHITIDGTEDRLMKMVYIHGAAVVSIRYSNETAYQLYAYKNAAADTIFECSEEDLNPDQPKSHAMAVVGYDTDASTGKPYWLLKNSWGPEWGQECYLKLIRGVGACQIGKELAAVECQSISDCLNSESTNCFKYPPSWKRE